MAADDHAPTLPPGLLGAAWLDRAVRVSDADESADALGVAIQLYERARAEGSDAYVTDEATALVGVGRVHDALVLLAETFDRSLVPDSSTDRDAAELAVRCARLAACFSSDADQFEAAAQWAVRASRAALERAVPIDPAFDIELAESLDEQAPGAAAIVREEALRAMSESPSATLPPVIANGRPIEPAVPLGPAERRDLWFGLLQKSLADACKDAGEPWEEHAVAAARSLDRRVAWELVPDIAMDAVRSCADLAPPVDWGRERTGEEPPVRRIARELSAVAEAPEDEIERAVALERARLSWQDLRADAPELVDSAWVLGLADLVDDERLYEDERRDAEAAFFDAAGLVGRMVPEAHAVLAERLDQMDEPRVPTAFAPGDEVLRHTVEALAGRATGADGSAVDASVLVDRLQAHAGRCGPEVTRYIVDHFATQPDVAGDATWCLARAAARMISVGGPAKSDAAVTRDRQEVVELLVATVARSGDWMSLGSPAKGALSQVMEARSDLPLDLSRAVEVIESTEQLGAGVGLSVVDACDALEPLAVALDEAGTVDALNAIRQAAIDRFVEERIQALEDADQGCASQARAAALEAVRELTEVEEWATAASLARAADEAGPAPTSVLDAEARGEPDEVVALREIGALDVSTPGALAGAISSGRARPEVMAIVVHALNASDDLRAMTESHVPMLGAVTASMDDLLAAVLEQPGEVDPAEMDVPHLRARRPSSTRPVDVLDEGLESPEGLEPGACLERDEGLAPGKPDDPGDLGLPGGF